MKLLSRTCSASKSIYCKSHVGLKFTIDGQTMSNLYRILAERAQLAQGVAPMFRLPRSRAVAVLERRCHDLSEELLLSSVRCYCHHVAMDQYL